MPFNSYLSKRTKKELEPIRLRLEKLNNKPQSDDDVVAYIIGQLKITVGYEYQRKKEP